MVGRESLDRAMGNGHRGTDCSQRKKSVPYARGVLDGRGRGGAFQLPTPPGLPDPLQEETKNLAPNTSSKVESRLPVTSECSSQLDEQWRLSILNWNAGPKRGEVTGSITGAFHVIMVQEAGTHYFDIAKDAEQQFHVCQDADQLILCHKKTFEPGGVKSCEEIPGTLKHDSFGLKNFMVKTKFRRPAKDETSACVAASANLSNTTAKRRDVAKRRRNAAEENGADIIAGDFNSATFRERGKEGVLY